MRGLAVATIHSHLATMYERGENLDIHQWVAPEEIDLIHGSLGLFEEPYSIKAIEEHFAQRFGPEKIRWALAEHKRRQPGA